MTILQVILARHAMDHRKASANSDPHTLRCDSAKIHSSKPPFNATIGFSNRFFVCIFTKRQELKEKPRFVTVLQLNQNRYRRYKIDRFQRRYIKFTSKYSQNHTVSLKELKLKSKSYHHSFIQSSYIVPTIPSPNRWSFEQYQFRQHIYAVFKIVHTFDFNIKYIQTNINQIKTYFIISIHLIYFYTNFSKIKLYKYL